MILLRYDEDPRITFTGAISPCAARPGARCGASSHRSRERTDTLRGAGGFDFPGGLPGPRRRRVQLVVLGTAGDNAFEHIGQPCQRLDVVQRRGHGQRRDVAQ